MTLIAGCRTGGRSFMLSLLSLSLSLLVFVRGRVRCFVQLLRFIGFGAILVRFDLVRVLIGAHQSSSAAVNVGAVLVAVGLKGHAAVHQNPILLLSFERRPVATHCQLVRRQRRPSLLLLLALVLAQGSPVRPKIASLIWFRFCSQLVRRQ